MIYHWLKRNRDLLDARSAARRAQTNHEVRMREIIASVSDEIDSAVRGGEHGVTIDHQHDAATTEELHRRIKEKGYLVQPITDEGEVVGTYIAWLPAKP